MLCAVVELKAQLDARDDETGMIETLSAVNESFACDFKRRSSFAYYINKTQTPNTQTRKQRAIDLDAQLGEARQTIEELNALKDGTVVPAVFVCSPERKHVKS